MVEKKSSRATTRPAFKAELVYAEPGCSDSFGLLADLVLDEIRRQRQATAARLNHETSPPAAKGSVHYS